MQVLAAAVTLGGCYLTAPAPPDDGPDLGCVPETGSSLTVAHSIEIDGRPMLLRAGTVNGTARVMLFDASAPADLQAGCPTRQVDLGSDFLVRAVEPYDESRLLAMVTSTTSTRTELREIAIGTFDESPDMKIHADAAPTTFVSANGPENPAFIGVSSGTPVVLYGGGSMIAQATIPPGLNMAKDETSIQARIEDTGSEITPPWYQVASRLPSSPTAHFLLTSGPDPGQKSLYTGRFNGSVVEASGLMSNACQNSVATCPGRVSRLVHTGYGRNDMEVVSISATHTGGYFEAPADRGTDILILESTLVSDGQVLIDIAIEQLLLESGVEAEILGLYEDRAGDGDKFLVLYLDALSASSPRFPTRATTLEVARSATHIVTGAFVPDKPPVIWVLGPALEDAACFFVELGPPAKFRSCDGV